MVRGELAANQFTLDSHSDRRHLTSKACQLRAFTAHLPLHERLQSLP